MSRFMWIIHVNMRFTYVNSFDIWSARITGGSKNQKPGKLQTFQTSLVERPYDGTFMEDT